MLTRKSRLALAALSVLALAAAPVAQADESAAYTKAVLTKIMNQVVYPKIARIRNQEGVVALALTIDASGAVTSAAIEHSSGVQSLDDAALETAKTAGPFPAPSTPTATVHGNVKFALND